eukprot:GHRR01020210.1.p1 GENE.GHRR01020210.1~~GHRR01020210.1.p1  ORF type:complete len:139 (-),score=5.54 GHRR01020210.1:551-967(-)
MLVCGLVSCTVGLLGVQQQERVALQHAAVTALRTGSRPKPSLEDLSESFLPVNHEGQTTSRCGHCVSAHSCDDNFTAGAHFRQESRQTVPMFPMYAAAKACYILPGPSACCRLGCATTGAGCRLLSRQGHHLVVRHFK